jgi:hypothetical protein
MAAAIAAHAAREEERKKDEEEEELTTYRKEELEQGWEFKILRSALSEFRNPQVFARAVETERMGGWELVEKFDDERVRFRRPIAARANDAMLPAGYDPYRTRHGMGEGLLAFWVIFAIFGVVALIFGGLWMSGAFN